MRVINKKMAMGLLGTVLSVVPMASTKAQSAAASTTRHLHSSTITAAKKNLSGVSKDTYDATKKVSTSARKKVTNVVRNQYSAVKSIVKAPEIAPKGTELLKETDSSRFYSLDNKALAAFLDNQADTAAIQGVIMEVPRENASQSQAFDKLLGDCNMKIVYKLKSGHDASGNKVESQLTVILGKPNGEWNGEKKLRVETYYPDGTSQQLRSNTNLAKAGESETGTLLEENFDNYHHLLSDNTYFIDNTNIVKRDAELSEYRKCYYKLTNPVRDLADLDIPEKEVYVAKSKLSKAQQEANQNLANQQMNAFLAQQNAMMQQQLLEQQMINQQNDLVNSMNQISNTYSNREAQTRIQHIQSITNAANAPTYGTR